CRGAGGLRRPGGRRRRRRALVRARVGACRGRAPSLRRPRPRVDRRWRRAAAPLRAHLPRARRRGRRRRRGGVPAVRRIVIGISGASGAVYGVRLLEVLAARSDAETHLVVSDGAATTIAYETGRDPAELARLATQSYDVRDLSSSLASGTFRTVGMVIAPCSIGT